MICKLDLNKAVKIEKVIKPPLALESLINGVASCTANFVLSPRGRRG